LPSELIGLIETDCTALPFECRPYQETAGQRRHWRSADRAACMISSAPLSTEFVDADIQLLQDELAAEFTQLLRRLQKR
jgi:hypothetical protein